MPGASFTGGLIEGIESGGGVVAAVKLKEPRWKESRGSVKIVPRCR